MARRIGYTGILLALYLAALILPPKPAAAAEDVPGDSCAGITAHSFRWAGGPENGGVVNGLFCEGNAWRGAINFQSSGRVGIGTTSPDAPLSVKGLSNNGTITATDGTSEAAIYVNHLSVPPVLFSSITNDNLGFSTGNGAATMTLTTAGRLGIGTMTPAAALHVVGDIRYTGVIVDISDRRAKKDIRPLPTGQLAKMMQLEPVSFVMKDDPKGRTELGLIAQDTEPLYPDLVQTDPDGTKSLGYVGLVAPLIKAMQEQQAEIDHLRAGLAVVFCIALVPGFLLWRNRAK